jgi:CheY-like chemotaxis protein
MDVAMPVMDGVEATRRIRAMQDKRASIPIIGLTAFALPEEQERFKEAGMNQILSKPMQRTALHATLSSALGSTGASTVRAVLPQATPMNELDTQALAEMTQGLSPSQLGELLCRVAEDIGTHTALALDCVNAGNTEGLARSCHVLKGLAGSFGNRELSLLTKRIEQHCRDGNIQAAISATLSDLDRMSRSAQVALDNYHRMKVTDNARGA